MTPTNDQRYLLPRRTRTRAIARHLIQGQDYLHHVLESVRQATTHIYLEFYIFNSDTTGYLLADNLIAAAGRGVRVCLIHDAFGSWTDSESVIEYMIDGGVEVVKYNPLTRFRILPRLSAVRRDHRKIVTIDGRLAFIGSGNVGDEYRDDYATSFFDVSLEFEGPAVSQIEIEFARVWNRYATSAIRVRQSGPNGPAPLAQVLANREHRARRVIERAYLQALRQSQSSIVIMNAYFVPNRRVRRALYTAAKRGVKVTLVVPKTTNHHLVHLAGRFFFGGLLQHGIKIYQWTDQILHAKCAVVDSCWTLVGSYNFDALSLQRNLEIAIAIADPQLGKQMERMLETKIGACEELTLDMWRQRPLRQQIQEWVAHKMRRWL